MTASTTILAGALAYVSLLMLVGYYASRNVRDGVDFVVAGRRLPLWLCTFTLFATWFGSGTLIGAAGAAFTAGIPGVLSNPIGSAICLLLAGVFYVRILRRMRLLTLPDLFRQRFGTAAEILCAACIIPAYVGWVASIFVAFGFVLQTVAGIDTTTAIVISAFVTLVYTFAGGMWAVTLTDFVQAIIIIVGLIVLYPLVIGDVGGLGALVARAPERHFAFLPESTVKDWLWFTQALLVIGLGNIASQDLMQRAFSARDERVAQWSMYLATILYVTVAMIPVLLGIAGRVLVPEIGEPELILPTLGMRYLPPAAMAVFVGALFAALMSSADGGVLAPASIFGQNIVKVFKPEMSERELLRTIRHAILGAGAFALVTALYFQNVYVLMVKSFSILFVGLIAPMTAALYWPKANNPGAVASIVVGVCSWLGIEIIGTDYPAELIAAALGVGTLVVVTLTTSTSTPARALTDIDGNALEYRDRLGTLGLYRR